MSAEDLTTLAGASVQQDLALVSLLGLGHVERNGHHFVDGMSFAPEPKQASFAGAIPTSTGGAAVPPGSALTVAGSSSVRSGAPASPLRPTWTSPV
jgi:hypothetical protein